MPEVTNTPGTPQTTEVLSWYRRLYLKVEALSAGPQALTAMLAVSVADASFFPIPPFALLVPMVLARPRAWWRLALWGTLASLAGGVGGYFIGKFGGQAVSEWLHVDVNFRVHRFGIDSTAGEILTRNFWMLALACSILPTPFKLVSIGSGLLGVSFPAFMAASVMGRSVRFFLVAGVMAAFGPKARKWLRV
jgi:membrane protein YqaA with SNARE-associated domain